MYYSCCQSNYGFNGYFLLSQSKAENRRSLKAIIVQEKIGIYKRKKKLGREKLKIFTGLTAFFFFLWIHWNSNYTVRGQENCMAYDKYLSRTVDILPGEMVACLYRYSELVIKTTDSIVIYLKSWKVETVYANIMDEDGNIK